MFVFWNTDLFGQNVHLSFSLGYTKYKYDYKSIFDYRSKFGTTTPCLVEIQRSQFTRWVSPEFQILGHYSVFDFFEISSGFRYHIKGKDITAQLDLSCLQKFPIVQLRSAFLGIPLYIQSNPKNKIGLKAGFIYGLKIRDRELQNDSQFVKLNDSRLKKLFPNSRELNLEFRFNFSNSLHFFLGGILGLDHLNDQFIGSSPTYKGIRAIATYKFFK